MAQVSVPPPAPHAHLAGPVQSTPPSGPQQQPTGPTCKVCRELITGSHINANDSRYHNACFVCHQCLEPFPENIFFETEGRFYCEFDYTVLHGARCGRCGEIIRGKCITAMDMKWHPDHFTCVTCGKSLAGSTFVKKKSKPYCKPCVERLKVKEKAVELCDRCKKPVNEALNESLIVINNKKFHAHHFNCSLCKLVLGQDAKMYEGKLYCAICLDKMTLRICQACRRPIVGRSVTALSKYFHPEHFVCAKCEKPFNASQYWDYKGKPYCEGHYHELMGDVCAMCHEPAIGKTITAMGRKFCQTHFNCIGCHLPLMTSKHGFIDWDYKPMCRRCFDVLPAELRRKMGKMQEREKKVLEREKALAGAGVGK
ncbi:uncharacterized protein EV422DRAFT_568834 [Fimicolochytrium jonesii]|uniref:uncharacterized protein n=1 Tax=Fimicolochytrium jonesii TaxID=1396493 RepID=UPI0022FE0877|nr:uncharacterized protein EV422DRAFT_568834 [Fimicolochytrium jonesii]KAI8819404.1 hypothetical protein EV422DRAFT_568834 [Fimicolochytrium jonesii]